MKSIARPVGIIAGGGLLLALVLALDLIPFLRGGYGWRWPYDPPGFGRALPLIAATGVYVAGAWVLLRRETRSAVILLWSMSGAAILPLAVIGQRADGIFYELFVRTASQLATGPHHAAAVIDWGDPSWHDWPATMDWLRAQGNGHAALSPPGLPLWYHLLNSAFEAVPGLADPLGRALIPYQCHNFNLLAYSPAEWASAWFGVLMPFWAALTALPLYATARRLLGAATARQTVIWWALVPGLVMFAPTWNTLYPLLAVLAFWLLVVGLDRDRRAAIPLIGAGVVCGLLTFANFSSVPLLGVLGFYTLLRYLLNERRTADPPSWPRPVIAGAWVGVGLIAPWIVYGLLTGGTPVEMLQSAMQNHLDQERQYLPWVWLHAWEWALFSGIPLVALWLLASGSRLRRWPDSGPVLGLALLLTMVILAVSGTARGETGRVWLFFTPFVVIAAARALVTSGGARSWRGWLVITVCQAALMLVLAITLVTINAGFTLPPDPPGVSGPLAAARPADAVFGDSLRLAGWDAEVDTDANAVSLRLEWQPETRIMRPYWFSALLIAPDGTVAPDAVLWQPFDAAYPVTCWAPGARIVNRVVLPLPNGAPPGEWWISLSVFDGSSGDYAPLPLRGGTDSQVGLGPVVVP